MDALEEFLTSAKAEKVAGTSDEAVTKQGLVLPVLNRLGWSVFDTTEVAPEHSTGTWGVDHALRCEKE
jgi:predicted type IV restriction endonuclease